MYQIEEAADLSHRLRGNRAAGAKVGNLWWSIFYAVEESFQRRSSLTLVEVEGREAGREGWREGGREGKRERGREGERERGREGEDRVE